MQAGAAAQQILVSRKYFFRCKGKERDGADNEARFGATILKHLCWKYLWLIRGKKE